MASRFVHKNTTRAVHGFDRKALLVDVRKVHILFVVLVMSALMPKSVGEHHWSTDLIVTSETMLMPPEVRYGVV